MARKYGVDTDDFDEESYDAAEELMNREELNQCVTSENIDFVFSVIKKEAPHDKQSIKQLYLGMLSAFTKVVIHNAVSSKNAGAGKSYLLVLVAGYIPKVYVISLTGMSDKAMLHKAGIMVVEDDDGQPVPLDPLLHKLDDDKENLMDEISELTNSKSNDTQAGKKRLKEIRKSIRQINGEIKSLKDKAEKLIDLENKIILFLDTTQDSLFNALMSLISQDTKDDQKYEYVDTNGSKMETKANRFKGIPAIFTCQVVDDSRQVRYAEKNRRFIHVIPETTEEKIQTAMDHIGLRFGLAPEEYDSEIVTRNDKKEAQRITGLLVKKLIAHSKYFDTKESGIKVFFPRSITRSIIKNPNDVWGMTVADRIFKYLTIITKMHMDSRPRLIDTTVEDGKKFYPISTFDDLKETLELMGLASSTLRPYIVDWYNRVFIPAFKELNGEPYELRSNNGSVIMQEIHVGLNTKQLGDKTAEVMGKSKPNSEDLLKHYLYPLLNLGVIDKVRSTIDGKANIYFPVEEGNINTLFSDPDDKRLEVYDPSHYPTKQYLEESTRTIVEYCSKGRGVGDFKYRLVDHEGNDIDFKVLVDRYLSNPEICFKESTKNVNSENEKQVPPLVCSNIPRQFSNNITEDSSVTDDNGNGEIWSCAYCIISNRIDKNANMSTRFPTLNAYEKHIITSHRNQAGQKNLTFDPEPEDLKKFECELIAAAKNQNNSKSKVAEMAAANEAGDGVMFASKEGADR
jgi:hypothetical protein